MSGNGDGDGVAEQMGVGRDEDCTWGAERLQNWARDL